MPVQKSKTPNKAYCSLCLCRLKGDYPAFILEDPNVTFKCKKCMAIDIKVTDPTAPVEALLIRNE